MHALSIVYVGRPLAKTHNAHKEACWCWTVGAKPRLRGRLWGRVQDLQERRTHREFVRAGAGARGGGGWSPPEIHRGGGGGLEKGHQGPVTYFSCLCGIRWWGPWDPKGEHCCRLHQRTKVRHIAVCGREYAIYPCSPSFYGGGGSGTGLEDGLLKQWACPPFVRASCRGMCVGMRPRMSLDNGTPSHVRGPGQGASRRHVEARTREGVLPAPAEWVCQQRLCGCQCG